MKLLVSASAVLAFCLTVACAQPPAVAPVAADGVTTASTAPGTPATATPVPDEDVYVDPPAPVLDRPVRLVAWNLAHFVDPWDNPYVRGQKENTPETKSAEELELMAKAIARMDADVLMLTEVEDDRSVKLFLDSFVPGHGYRYFACMPSMGWHQNLVVASRLPMGPVVSFREVNLTNPVANQTRSTYNSRLMCVEIRPNDQYRFQLFGAHLKAGGEAKDPVWRQEQVKLIKQYCADYMKGHPDANIVLLGDMNLTQSDAEYKLLTDGTPMQFLDPATDIGFEPTHPANGPRRRIDMALFNPAMKPEYIQGSISVPRPLSTREMAKISDHLPTLIAFHPKEMPGS